MRPARPYLPLFIAGVVLLIALFILPIGLDGVIDRCGLASAQDNPCLAQEATISAQEVQILRLELTGTALQASVDELSAVAASLTPVPATLTPIPPTLTTVAETAAPAEPTARATQPLPALSPSPDASGTQIEIVRVIGAGQVSNEAVILRNTGTQAINLNGWRLSDDGGDTFIFPDRTLPPDGRITVYTASGTSTEGEVYWRLNRAAWDRGDRLRLTDRRGNLFATFEIE